MKTIRIFLIYILIYSSLALSQNFTNNIPNYESNNSSHFSGMEAREGQKFSAEFRKVVLDSAPEILNRYLRCAKDKNCPEKAKPRTLWIHGPSGSGKTTMAQVFADELGIKCIVLNASLLGNKYVNSIPENFAKNVQPFLDQPCVVVFDEIDFLLKESSNSNDPHERIPQQAWQILDYLKTLPHVIVIGTSNTIKNISEQVETRFAGNRIYMAATDSLVFRKNILALHFKDLIHELDVEAFKKIAEKTKEFSLRELEKVVEISASISFGRGKAPFLITKKDIDDAIVEFKKDKSAAKEANSKPMIDYEEFKAAATKGAGWSAGGLGLLGAVKAFCYYKGWDCSFLEQKK